MSSIKNAINSMIEYWKNEGDVADINELRSDAFQHLRWLLEKGMNIQDAIIRMQTH